MKKWWNKIKSDFLPKSIYDLLKYIVIIFLPAIWSLILSYFGNFSRLKLGIYSAIFLLILLAAWRIYNFGKKRYQLISNSGLFYYRENATTDDQTNNQKLLLEKIKNARTIEIIGATGYNTFARKDAQGQAVLRDALENTAAEIKILLLHPHELQTRIRATSLGVPLNNYQQEILSSMLFLKELKNKGRNVSLKLYGQQPIWKIIVLDNFLWLQYYHPRMHVEKTPVYGISRRNERNSFNLFDPLYAVLQKKWLHDGNPIFDFDTNEIVYNRSKDCPERRIKLDL